MTTEYKDKRYNEGVRAGIEYRAKFCRATFDVSGSCDNCIIKRYNTTGVSCATFLTQNPDVLTKLVESRLPATERDDADFMSGFSNGIQLVASCCALNDSECFNCPLGEAMEDGTDCLDFCADNADAVADIMADFIANGGIPFKHSFIAPYPIKTVGHMEKPEAISSRTYYDEFCVRMPTCSDSIESVASGCCRNVCFGLGACPQEDEDSTYCVKCWSESYV